MNVVRISGTPNSEPIAEKQPVPACDPALPFLKGPRHTYATNLVKDWHAQILHYEGLKPKSANAHRDNFFRLLNHARVAPWELTKSHITKYLESRVDAETGESLAPATIAARFSAWRSLQSFMLEPDRVNEILAQFKVRPRAFITEENGIAVKKHKANWIPKGWALTPEQIDAIDETFRFEIMLAHKNHTKSLLPLQRDRAMFHVAVHFALRVSELVTLTKGQFRPSHDAKLKAQFGNLGVLTVTGKNEVTGSIPMREPEMHALLEWYLGSCRQKLLLRRKEGKDAAEDTGTCTYDEKTYRVGDLIAHSTDGGQ